MAQQLECRIVVTYHTNRRVEVGMFDPVSGRYEQLGSHGPAQVDKVVRDLAVSIERAGHRLTFCERSTT
jgi:hypothetical protein